MSFVASLLRSVFHGSDRIHALAQETNLLVGERERANSLQDRLGVEFQSHDGAGATLGTAVDGGWPVRVARERLAGHAGLWGPSGSGKSYLLVLMLRFLLQSGVRRLVVADPKAETVELAKRLMVDYARTLPEQEAEDLLERVVCLDLFAATTLPRLQVLALQEGSDPELHAFTIANLITNELDNGGLGVRQETIFHRVIEALIRAGLPLTVLPMALENPELLDALAETHEPSAFFRALAARLRKESRDRILGLVSRAERLLRLKPVRLALGGSRDCIDFAKLLDERITLINLAPPHGSTDVGRFLAGLIWVQLNHAIRRRPNGSAPAYVCVDEWPTFLSAGGANLADTFEDLLRLARSKGVFLTVLSQDLASVAKVSRSIVDVVRNNLHLHMIFRAQDANAWDFALPVTGTRPKPPGPPWEERRFGYLDRGAELTLLREQLLRLPDRTCYLVDRRTGLPGLLMRTADLKLKASAAEVRALEEHASRSDAVATIAEMEAGERKVARKIEGLLSSASPEGIDEGGPARPPRRPRRPMDIG
ncbi:MAG: type IV secretory system conjugative DNA transfer family protein [Phycisphaerae bacterium]|nr:type IV secretory system conjugative DNA transfer family protein [Phycisphaerae bacterium]